MALERKWSAVPATPFTANGTSIGIITISDTAGFYTKSKVQVTSNSLQPAQFQVQQVLSPTQLVLGPVGSKVGREHHVDMSPYLMSDGAAISAPEQDKSNIPDKDHYVAVYESDPVVADRVIQVDKHGQKIGSTQLSNGDIAIKVDDTKVTLFTKPYDAITAEYPTSTQEVYKSRLGGIVGIVVETVVVNYTDSTKNSILNAFRS